MTTPLASIVIPVGPVHREHVHVAIASCLWQTIPDFEVVVANDSGATIQVQRDDRVRVVRVPQKSGKKRASVARNTGIEAARGTFSIFLDADDYLLPTALETFVRGHVQHDAAYSYGHHYAVGRGGDYMLYRPPEYSRAKKSEVPPYSALHESSWLSMQLCNLHPITAFAPTWCLRAVGGLDEAAPGFEDWTIWLRLAIAGWCGERIYGPTFVYRAHEGTQHVIDAAAGRALMDAVTAPYRNSAGDIDMAGCGCGGGAAAAKAVARRVVAALGAPPMTEQGNLILEYIGRGQGVQSFRHPASKREYRAGAHPAKRYIQVPPEDADYLIGLGFFRQQVPPAPFVPAPVSDVTQALRPEADVAAVTPRPKYATEHAVVGEEPAELDQDVSTTQDHAAKARRGRPRKELEADPA